MKLYCLGTTGYHPSQNRHTACYYIPEHGIVLDAGTGAFRLSEHLLKQPRESLDIYLSHAHLDHVFGLTFILDTLAITELKKVRVFGDAEKLAAVRDHLFSDALFPVLPPFEFCSLGPAPGKMSLDGNVTLDWFPLEHPGGCLGFRFTFADGRRLAYITDTVASTDAGYVKHVRGVDLLLHECYFTDDNREFALKTGHSWVSAVCDLVRTARPKRTALIHINPIADLVGKPITLTAKQAALNIVLAEDGDCFEF